MSFQLMDEYLLLSRDDCQGRLTPELLEGAKDFVRTKFKEKSKTLFRAHYYDIPSFDNHTTGVNEGINRGLKNSNLEPRANDQVDGLVALYY